MISAKFNRNQRRLVSGIFLLSSVVAGTAGCSDGKPPKYQLSGTVTYEGQPIPDGTIMFVPADTHTAADTATITNGSYTLQLSAGKKQVRVEASKFIGPEDKSMGVRPRDQYLPAKYNIDTKLTTEVMPEDGKAYDLSLKK